MPFRDIAHCEDLMDTHQSRKSEIDAKADKFILVESTANELLDRNHYASVEIKERLDNLLAQRQVLDEEWDLHWEELQICNLFCFICFMLIAFQSICGNIF